MDTPTLLFLLNSTEINHFCYPLEKIQSALGTDIALSELYHYACQDIGLDCLK